MNIEIHITCNALTNDQIESFEVFCQSINAKPIVILLSKGENKQQLMISKIIDCVNKIDLDKELEFMKKEFQLNGYNITRVKMEIPPWEVKNAKNFISDESQNYFEWHGKIKLENGEKTASIIADYGGHLSRNVLKKDSHTKFITIRDYDTEEGIKAKINNLKSKLNIVGVSILKEELEYCIFDSNASLDKGWI